MFSVGDRVQVAESWFVEDLRGLQGTIVIYPDDLSGRRNAGAAWVEFDKVWSASNPLRRTVAAEIDAKHLSLIEKPA